MHLRYFVYGWRYGRFQHELQGHPLCMPADASAVPTAGGLTLPSIDIAKTLAKKTIDAAISGSYSSFCFPLPKHEPWLHFFVPSRALLPQAVPRPTSPPAPPRPPTTTLPTQFSPQVIWRQKLLKCRLRPRGSRNRRAWGRCRRPRQSRV